MHKLEDISVEKFKADAANLLELIDGNSKLESQMRWLGFLMVRANEARLSSNESDEWRLGEGAFEYMDEESAAILKEMRDFASEFTSLEKFDKHVLDIAKSHANGERILDEQYQDIGFMCVICPVLAWANMGAIPRRAQGKWGIDFRQKYLECFDNVAALISEFAISSWMREALFRGTT